MAVTTIKRPVYVAKLSRRQEDFFHPDFLGALLDALNPDRRVERPRDRGTRIWRLSQPQLLQGGYVAGKLGFERQATKEEVRYSEQSHDFVSRESVSLEGHFAYYVIDAVSHIMVFEERRPDLSRGAFLEVFRLIVGTRVEVDPLPDAAGFEAFLKEVDAVEIFQAWLKRPNPGFGHAREVRRAVEETNSREFILRAKAEEGDGLVIPDTILGDAAEHASRGNGRVRARAKKAGRTRVYDSAIRLLKGIIEVSRDDDEPSIIRKLMEKRNELAPSRTETQLEVAEDEQALRASEADTPNVDQADHVSFRLEPTSGDPQIEPESEADNDE